MFVRGMRERREIGGLYGEFRGWEGIRWKIRCLRFCIFVDGADWAAFILIFMVRLLSFYF